LTTKTTTWKRLQPIHHNHLNHCLKSKRYTSVSSLQAGMQKKMSNIYETQDIIVLDPIPDKIYTTNPSSNKIENFIELLNPTTPFQIIRSFDISSQNYKLQYPRVYSNSTFYSMTYKSSSYWSKKIEITIVIDSGASKSITPISSDFKKLDGDQI